MTIPEAADDRLVTDQSYDVPIEGHEEGSGLSGESGDDDGNENVGIDDEGVDDEGDYSGDSQSTNNSNTDIAIETTTVDKSAEEENNEFYEEEDTEESSNTEATTEINTGITEVINAMELTTNKEVIDTNQEEDYDQENYKDEDGYDEDYDKGDYSEEDVKYQGKSQEAGETMKTTTITNYGQCAAGFTMDVNGICSGM